jgi:glycosyltransferase involved in cell wall biosynthesis
MTICIITHVPHILNNGKYFAYAPYVREMNIWTGFTDNVIIVAPIENSEITQIHLENKHSKIEFHKIPQIDLLGLNSIIKSVFKSPKIFWEIFKAMRKANHIHLRCPGNIGLMGCIVQILFPSKPKTAKYAGNWDPKSKQPWSYKLQKWILSNTFLTKNMQVLVYGEWQNQTKNIKPFFTASYSENDKVSVEIRKLENEISFIFVGTLSKGKQPLYAIQIVEKLYKNGNNVSLSIYGNGQEKDNIESYILQNNLHHIIKLKGNQTQEVLKNEYQKTHFLLLPSISEGWPKVVAEAMFFGCLPITTSVSCLPNMLDNGNRGLLLKMDIDKDLEQIHTILNSQNDYNEKVKNSIQWSRRYTLDVFENEIKVILQ